MLIMDAREQPLIRGLTFAELGNALGLEAATLNNLLQGPLLQQPEILRDTTPFQCLAQIFQAIKTVEEHEPIDASPNTTLGLLSQVQPEERQALKSMTPAQIKSPLALALPDMAAWADATELDDDLRRVILILKGKEKNTPTGWVNNGFFRELEGRRLETEDGVVYRYEVTARKTLRQVRMLVVPEGLRQVVMSACHANPMAGHMDAKKTLWRAMSRFWWPNRLLNYIRGLQLPTRSPR